MGGFRVIGLLGIFILCLILGQACGVPFQPRTLDVTEERLTGAGALKTCQAAPDVGHVTIHRLNRVEYDNTIRDLLGVGSSPVETFPPDEYAGNFNNNAKVHSVTPDHIEKYLLAAETVVDAAFANSALRSRIMTCDPAVAGCVGQIVAAFAERAYRRPPTSDEVSRLENLVKVAQSEGDGIETGIRLALQSTLLSPSFLYRYETQSAPNDANSVAPLSQYALATRISYFLWSSMPDEDLYGAAKAGKLGQEEELRRQVLRMLKDGRAKALVENFASQWLTLHHLENAQPDSTKFPSFSPELKADMRTETEMMIKDIIARDGSLFEILTANYSFLNERLANHYGLGGVTGPQFRKVHFNDGSRVGLLTHASLMTVNANPDRTSIVKRGKWVLENLLCTAPPPPPPEVVGVLPPATTETTLRERMEIHRQNPVCFSCHAQMDPIGFALENYDGIGRWRDTDSGKTIDTMGQFPDGRKFTGAKELADVLRQEPKFKACVAEKTMVYALGRQLESNDHCTANRIGLETVHPDKPFSEMVLAIIKSDPFKKQRGDGGQQ